MRIKSLFLNSDDLTVPVLQSVCNNHIYKLSLLCDDLNLLDHFKLLSISFTVLDIFGDECDFVLLREYLSSFEFSELLLSGFEGRHATFWGNITAFCPTLKVLSLPYCDYNQTGFNLGQIEKLLNWKVMDFIRVDLVRVVQSDKYTICVDNVYFQVVGIEAGTWDVTDSELICCLPTVRILTVKSMCSQELLQHFANSCHLLKELYLIVNGLTTPSLVTLLKNNVMLTVVFLNVYSGFDCFVTRVEDVVSTMTDYCKYLEKVRFLGVSIPMSSIKHLLLNCTRLTYVYAYYKDSIVDDDASMFHSIQDLVWTKSMPNTIQYSHGKLQHITVGGKISEEMIKTILRESPQLIKVELSEVLTSDLLLVLSKHCPLLRSLRMNDSQLPTSCLESFPMFEYLTVLKLPFHEGITSDQLLSFTKSVPRLVKLDLCCTRIPCDADIILRTNCSKLRHIHIDGSWWAQRAD